MIYIIYMIYMIYHAILMQFFEFHCKVKVIEIKNKPGGAGVAAGPSWSFFFFFNSSKILFFFFFNLDERSPVPMID